MKLEDKVREKVHKIYCEIPIERRKNINITSCIDSITKDIEKGFQPEKKLINRVSELFFRIYYNI